MNKNRASSPFDALAAKEKPSDFLKHHELMLKGEVVKAAEVLDIMNGYLLTLEGLMGYRGRGEVQGGVILADARQRPPPP